AAQRYAREGHLTGIHGPQGEHVGARPRRCDADLLAGELLDLANLGIGLHDQIPAVVAVRAVGDALYVDALLEAGGDARRRIQDQVGRTRGDRLEAFGAPAVDGELDVEPFLLEQFLAQRRLADDG